MAALPSVQVTTRSHDAHESLLQNAEEGREMTRQRVRVSFCDLEYWLPSNVKRGTIACVLKRTSAFFNPGEMTAVMGPSGCGKSILMDVLSGRRTRGKINGSIRYMSEAPTPKLLRHWTGYVEQFSTLLEHLTVFEMLMYTAELKRPFNESRLSKRQAVELLISKLALTTCRDVRIGNPHLDRGISGGEGKRVNIGIALITNPPVIYMDEPISGLDSYTANEAVSGAHSGLREMRCVFVQVMEVVKNLARDGMTVCATLHSPTPFTFSLFDRLLVLVQGNTVFFGNRDQVVTYFEALQLGSFSQNQSVAEWLTEIIVKAENEDRAPILIESYQLSPLSHHNREQAVAQIEKNGAEIGGVETYIDHDAATPPHWFTLLTLLRYRSLKNLTRLSFYMPRVLEKIVIVILICVLYRGIGSDLSFLNYTNLSALMFIWATFSASGAVIYVPELVLERWVFYREQRDGMYPVFAYFFMKAVEEGIIAAILSVVISFILWYVVELQGEFLRFLFIFFGMLTTSIFLAFFFGAVAPTMDIANALFPCYMMTLLFYAGYLLLPRDIPKWLVWYSKIDFVRYAYSALMVNQFRVGGHYEDPEERPIQDIYLMVIGLDDVDPDWYIGVIFIFSAAFGLLAYLALRFIRYERKR